MRYFSTFLIMLFMYPLAVFGEDLAPFTSDGCSSFPNGTLEQKELWLNCCEAHDYAYWKGGTAEERIAADTELKACVDAVGEPEIASLMLAGVRVGGSPYLPTTFRWGYGWPYPRGYKALTNDELVQINKALPPASTDDDSPEMRTE